MPRLDSLWHTLHLFMNDLSKSYTIGLMDWP